MYSVLVCKSVAICSHSKLISVIIGISLINENAYTKILDYEIMKLHGICLQNARGKSLDELKQNK